MDSVRKVAGRRRAMPRAAPPPRAERTLPVRPVDKSAFPFAIAKRVAPAHKSAALDRSS
jgi:hypothetical protein